MATDPVHGAEAAQWGGWTWRKPRRGEHFRRCSYCGSINPEDLAAEPTWQASWADRKYGWPHKFYVDVPNRDPDNLFVISSRFEAKTGPHAPGGERYQPPEPGYIAWRDLTRKQRAIAKRGGYRKADYVQFGTRDVHHAKFYTAHLADPALSRETKQAIEQRSGLRFHFHDGTVRWEAATAPREE